MRRYHHWPASLTQAVDVRANVPHPRRAQPQARVVLEVNAFKQFGSHEDTKSTKMPCLRRSRLAYRCFGPGAANKGLSGLAAGHALFVSFVSSCEPQSFSYAILPDRLTSESIPCPC